jgi:hypothetical protein
MFTNICFYAVVFKLSVDLYEKLGINHMSKIGQIKIEVIILIQS